MREDETRFAFAFETGLRFFLSSFLHSHFGSLGTSFAVNLLTATTALLSLSLAHDS